MPDKYNESTPPRPPVAAAAQDYLNNRHWKPIPVKPKSKAPVSNKWQNVKITPKNVLKRFKHGLNIGVQLGPVSNGLVDSDLDCEEAIRLAPYFLPKTDSIFGRAGALKSHWLYNPIDLLEESVINYFDEKNSKILELRIGNKGTGIQTVFPPSIHQDTGEVIEWHSDGKPSEPLFDYLQRKSQLLATASLLLRYWPNSEGGRHELALRVGGFLSRAGLTDDEVEEVITAVATEAKDAEVKDRITASQWATKYGFPELAKALGESVASAIAKILDFKTVVWSQPVDLWESLTPPALPHGLLPPMIEEFARTEGAMIGADPAGLAMAAVTVCAAAIPDKIMIRPNRHTPWMESARFWVALVGYPAAKKSPEINRAAGPIKQIDKFLYEQYAANKAAYDALPPEERKKAKPPMQTRIRIEDTTIEAAQEVLKDSPDGLLCLQDELSGFFGMMDRYSGKRGASKDRAFWLQSWNGGDYVLNRINRGPVYIPNLSVSLLGGIQPDTIRKIMEDTVDDGLLQRACPVMLRPATMSQDTPQEPSKYGDLIKELHALEPPQPVNAFLPERVLRFNEGAQQIKYDMERKHLEFQSVEVLNKKLSAHAGKYDGIFARLCVIWHCVENSNKVPLPAVVTEDTTRRVARFLHEFLWPHAVAFYIEMVGLSEDHEQLVDVAGYILAHKLDKITNRDIQRGSGTMRKMTKKDTDRIFEQLDTFGWISRNFTALPGRPPSDLGRWDVNPQVHTMFKEKGKQEAIRRRKARENIVLKAAGR